MIGSKKNSSAIWTDLPNDIWILILQMLPIEDCLRCSSVCSSLCSIIHSLKSCSPEPRIPWLRIPDADHDDRLNLFDVATNKVHTIILRELRESTIIGSSHGWLILAHEATADLRLFNPFTRDQILLPPTISLTQIDCTSRDFEGRIYRYNFNDGRDSFTFQPHFMCRNFFKTAILELYNSGFAVVVTYGVGSSLYMAFARQGDLSWIALETSALLSSDNHLSCTFFNGLLYVLDMVGELSYFDLDNIRGANYLIPQPVHHGSDQFKHELGFGRCTMYMAAFSGSRDLVHMCHTPCHGIRFYKFDFKEKEWGELANLGGHSLFLVYRSAGRKGAMSLQLPQRDIKDNCIFLAEPQKLRVLDIKTGSDIRNSSIKSCWKEDSKYRQEPYWISPVLTDLAGP